MTCNDKLLADSRFEYPSGFTLFLILAGFLALSGCGLFEKDKAEVEILTSLDGFQVYTLEYGQTGPENARLIRYDLPETESYTELATGINGHNPLAVSFNGRLIAYLRRESPEGGYPVHNRLYVYDTIRNKEYPTQIAGLSSHSVSFRWSPTSYRLILTSTWGPEIASWLPFEYKTKNRPNNEKSGSIRSGEPGLMDTNMNRGNWPEVSASAKTGKTDTLPETALDIPPWALSLIIEIDFSGMVVYDVTARQDMGLSGSDESISSYPVRLIHLGKMINAMEFSPDGRYISFVDYPDFGINTSGIGFVMRLDDLTLTAVTSGLRIVSGLSWSPDSERLAFVELQGEQYVLSRMHKSGSDHVRLLKRGNIQRVWHGMPTVVGPLIAWDNRVLWAPDGQSILMYNFGLIGDGHHQWIRYSLRSGNIRWFFREFNFMGQVRPVRNTPFVAFDGVTIRSSRGQAHVSRPGLFIGTYDGTSFSWILSTDSSNGYVIVPAPGN